MTFFHKFIIPIIMLVMWVYVIFREIESNAGGSELYTLIFFIIAIPLFIYFYQIRLKVVKIDNGKMYVSNYFKEIEIEKCNIFKVKQNVFGNNRPILIYLKKPTIFGSKIVFIPTYIFPFYFSPHPIVEELNDFIGIKKK